MLTATNKDDLGAWMNDKRIRVSGRRHLHEAVFASGIPFAAQKTLPATMQDLARQNFAANGSTVTGVIPENIVIVHGERESKLTMSGTGASLGHLIELGTDPHEQPNRGIVHPGAEPKPFMRPAFDEGRSIAVARARQTVWAALARVLAAGRR